MAKIVIIGGGFGTDAGGWYIDENGVFHRVPGWSPEALAELQHVVNVIREASQLKAPGLAEATTKAAVAFLHKEISKTMGEDAVVVFG
jgi:hypothetical protein